MAAAWVLATVFVRFCEDNHLIDEPYIAGPGERLADAEDRQAAFFRESPELNDRDWLIAGFRHLAQTHQAVAGLFDERRNALWEIEPSYEAATALLGFWRERGPDGEIIRDFTDEELDTRFLGDLYQDLSEHARKTYALLQTPEFVEEFILKFPESAPKPLMVLYAGRLIASLTVSAAPRRALDLLQNGRGSRSIAP